MATAEFAKAHGLKSPMEIAGWSMTSDASHFVSPNLTTVQRCMEETIANAGLQPEDIDAVNAHATSTKVGDKVEADALHNIFGKKCRRFRQINRRWAMRWAPQAPLKQFWRWREWSGIHCCPQLIMSPDPAIEIDCVAEGARKLKQEFVLKNAFGFGGCNSCVILRRIS